MYNKKIIMKIKKVTRGKGKGGGRCLSSSKPGGGVVIR